VVGCTTGSREVKRERKPVTRDDDDDDDNSNNHDSNNNNNDSCTKDITHNEESGTI